jgi:hypothetical protein
MASGNGKDEAIILVVEPVKEPCIVFHLVRSINDITQIEAESSVQVHDAYVSGLGASHIFLFRCPHATIPDCVENYLAVTLDVLNGRVSEETPPPLHLQRKVPVQF